MFLSWFDFLCLDLSFHFQPFSVLPFPSSPLGLFFFFFLPSVSHPQSESRPTVQIWLWKNEAYLFKKVIFKKSNLDVGHPSKEWPLLIMFLFQQIWLQMTNSKLKKSLSKDQDLPPTVHTRVYVLNKPWGHSQWGQSKTILRKQQCWPQVWHTEGPLWKRMLQVVTSVQRRRVSFVFNQLCCCVGRPWWHVWALAFIECVLCCSGLRAEHSLCSISNSPTTLWESCSFERQVTDQGHIAKE